MRPPFASRPLIDAYYAHPWCSGVAVRNSLNEGYLLAQLHAVGVENAYRRNHGEAEPIHQSVHANPVLQQRLAKYMVEQCFRNSELENLHAGKVPNSKVGDYPDVVVRTPFGEIPWPELSRFDGAKTKVLMLDMVNRTYDFTVR
jgi:hypothetical protein